MKQWKINISLLHWQENIGLTTATFDNALNLGRYNFITLQLAV